MVGIWWKFELDDRKIGFLGDMIMLMHILDSSHKLFVNHLDYALVSMETITGLKQVVWGALFFLHN